MKYSFRAVIKGHLGRECGRFLDGCRMALQKDGTTLLEGKSIDEDSLRGLLDNLQPTQLVYVYCVHSR